MKISKKPFILFFSTGFFSSYLSSFPGTIGTAVAVILLFALSLLKTPLWVLLAITLLLIPFSAWISDLHQKIYKINDDPKIVIDEMAGFFVAVAAFPFAWKTIFLGFVIFRFLDITKILFIKKAEKLKGGWGVTLDDVVAGIYTCIILKVILTLEAYIF